MFYTKEYRPKETFQPVLTKLAVAYGPVATEVLTKMIEERRLHSSFVEDLDFQWEHPQQIDWWFVKRNKTPNPILATLLDTKLKTERQQKKKVEWTFLSQNPAAASYLTTHLHEMDWNAFCENPADVALDLLELYPEKINYRCLCRNENPRAIALLRNHLSFLDYRDWMYLSILPNTQALLLLQEHPEQIWWCALSNNRHPEAYKILERNLDKVNWEIVGSNVAAIPLLRNHLSMVKWCYLCRDASTPEHFQFLRENRDQLNDVCWKHLSGNPHALPLLNDFPDKITMEAFRVHECYQVTYHYDYPAILAAKYRLHQEYHAWAGHPSQMGKWKAWEINTDLMEAIGDSTSFSY